MSQLGWLLACVREHAAVAQKEKSPSRDKIAEPKKGWISTGTGSREGRGFVRTGRRRWLGTTAAGEKPKVECTPRKQKKFCLCQYTPSFSTRHSPSVDIVSFPRIAMPSAVIGDAWHAHRVTFVLNNECVDLALCSRASCIPVT